MKNDENCEQVEESRSEEVQINIYSGWSQGVDLLSYWWMELGLLLKIRDKFGGIELQLLYSAHKSTVASCDWRYPVSKLVVERADTKRGCISVLQLYEGEQVVVSLRCFLVDDYLLLPEDGECEVFPSWRQPPPRWIMESMKQEWITLTWMRWSHMFRPPSKMKWSPAVSALISDEEIMLCCCKGS